LGQKAFLPGSNIQLNITLVDDNVAEADEQFSVTISSTDLNVTIVNGTANVTIVDNDGTLNANSIYI
jgi:hypothetical protein